MIPDVLLPNLSCVPIAISGEWLPSPKRDWQGHVTCSEPLVGVSILETPLRAEWCISERASEIRVAMFLYDKSGLDVSINFSVGDGGRRWGTVVSSPTYIPDIRAQYLVETGRVFAFCRIEGEPQITLKALFVARRDVKVGRKGLWHVRPELLCSLPVPFRDILAHGRTGIVGVE